MEGFRLSLSAKLREHQQSSYGYLHIYSKIILGFGVAAMLAGCHQTQSLTPEEAAGKHLYQVRCAHCHEDNDLALKKVPPDLHGIFDRKTLPSGAPATDTAVRQNVVTGKGMMPGFAGRFTGEQMSALLAYLHTGLR
jgi:mono/diheme cytochrome c family protein